MDEYIDIVDDTAQPIGETALKSIIHSKGYKHNTVHLWFYTSKGEILLAQRSANKTICPLLWDVSVSGHVDAGESLVQAAIRETNEEIGLKINESDLYKIGVFKCFQSYPNGIIDNEFHHTYLVHFNKRSISKLILQKEEVENVQLVTLIKFKTLIKNAGRNNYFVASNKPYYKIIVKSIEEQLISIK